MFPKLLSVSLLFSASVLLGACGEDKPSPAPVASPSSTQTQAASNHTLTSTAAGAVQLGMSLSEAIAALPNAASNTAADGEGIEWIEIIVEGETLMSVLLNEDHTISLIRVFSPKFVTPEGVAVGATLQSAADKLGGLTEIEFTEIESREFAKFKDMPDNTEFQVSGKDDKAGVYADGYAITAIASPSASISSIWIMQD